MSPSGHVTALRVSWDIHKRTSMSHGDVWKQFGCVSAGLRLCPPWQGVSSCIQWTPRASFCHCEADLSIEVHSCLSDPEWKTRLQWSLQPWTGCGAALLLLNKPKVLWELSLAFPKFSAAQDISCTWLQLSSEVAAPWPPSYILVLCCFGNEREDSSRNLSSKDL